MVIAIVILLCTGEARGFFFKQIFGGGKPSSVEVHDGDEQDGKVLSDKGMESGMQGRRGHDAENLIENSGMLVEKPLPDETLTDINDGDSPSNQKEHGSWRGHTLNRGGHENDRHSQIDTHSSRDDSAIAKARPVNAAVTAASAGDNKRQRETNLNSAEEGLGDNQASLRDGETLRERHRTELDGGRHVKDGGVERIADGNNVEGRDHDENLKSNDRYAGIRKEIEDLGRQLGPLPAEAGLDSDDADSKMDLHGHDARMNANVHSHAHTHTLLARGIEDAIAGLMNVYKALHVPEVGTHADTDVGMNGKEFGHDHDKAQILNSRDWMGRKVGNGEGTEGLLRGDGSTRTQRDKSGNGNDTMRENGSIRGSERVPAADADSDESTNDGQVKPTTSLMGLAVLGGVVAVAALGVLGVNYLNNRERSTQSQPLYPPRGPSFV